MGGVSTGVGGKDAGIDVVTGYGSTVGRLKAL